MKNIIILIILIAALSIGCTQKSVDVAGDKLTVTVNKATSQNESCIRADNCCNQDSDCWSTNGGCFTREWYLARDAEARAAGLHNEPPRTIDTPCSCVNNQCVVNEAK